MKRQIVLAFSLDTNLAKQIACFLKESREPTVDQLSIMISHAKFPQLSPSVLARNMANAFKPSGKASRSSVNKGRSAFSSYLPEDTVIKIVVADGALFKFNIIAELTSQGVSRDEREPLLTSSLDNLEEALDRVYMPDVEALSAYCGCEVQWEHWDRFISETETSLNISAFSYAGTADLWKKGVLPLAKLLDPSILSNMDSSAKSDRSNPVSGIKDKLENVLSEVLRARFRHSLQSSGTGFDWENFWARKLGSSSDKKGRMLSLVHFFGEYSKDTLVTALTKISKALYASVARYSNRDGVTEESSRAVMNSSISYIAHETASYAMYFLSSSAVNDVEYLPFGSGQRVCSREYKVMTHIKGHRWSDEYAVHVLQHAIQNAYHISGWDESYKPLVFSAEKPDPQLNKALFTYLCREPFLHKVFVNVLSTYLRRIEFAHNSISSQADLQMQRFWKKSLAALFAGESLPSARLVAVFDTIEHFEKRKTSLKALFDESKFGTQSLFAMESLDLIPIKARSNFSVSFLVSPRLPKSASPFQRKKPKLGSTDLDFSSDEVSKMILFFKCHGYDLFQELLTALEPVHLESVHKVATFQAPSKLRGEKYRPRLCFVQTMTEMPELNKQPSDRKASPTAGLVR